MSSAAGSTQEAPLARKGDARFQIGRPYQMGATWYHPKEDPGYDRSGFASWYGSAFDGRLTANGEIFDSDAITAAHPTLPLPSYVLVTNLRNNKQIKVRVNDRGPYSHRRLIDVSARTARLLGFQSDGKAPVRVQYLGRAPLEGGDEGVLLASYRTSEPAPPFMLAATEAAGEGAEPRRRTSILADASAGIQPETSVVAFADVPARKAGGTANARAAVDALAAAEPAENRISNVFQLIAEIKE